MKRITRRILAGFLAVMMLLSAGEIPALAANAEGNGAEYVAEMIEPVSAEVISGGQDGMDWKVLIAGTDDGMDVSRVMSTESVGLGVAYRSREDIEAFLAEKGTLLDAEVTYATKPVTSSPYQPGALSKTTLNSAIGMFNQVRYIAGLSYDVTLKDEYNELAQAASLVNYVNGTMSHHPEQPSDMDKELYDLGYKGAGESNIVWASWEDWPLNDLIVNSWMADDDDGNIARVGHRRWILNPYMKQTGFGVVKGDKGLHGAMYAFDNSDSVFGENDITGVAWPAQNMPIDYFGAEYPWSVSMGTEVDMSAIKVVLTRNSDGKKWRFSSASADGYFNVENGYYGQQGCIIFRPTKGDITAFKDGDSYHVEITKNNEQYVSYDVNFFEPEKRYQITYHLDGGENHGDNPSSYRAGSDTIVLKDPVKEGFIFDGWYKDSGFKEKITQIEKGSSGDLNLYAKWLARNYDKPYISATNITMNTKRTEGVTLSVYAAYGNAVTDIATESKEFAVSAVKDENTSEIRGVTIKPVQELADGIYHVELQYVTGNSAQDNKYTQDITVKVANKTPKLTIKQAAKFNYFYTDEKQSIVVKSTDGKIESLLLQDNSDFVGMDNGNGELVIALKNPKTTTKPATKANILVWVEGYREPVAQKVTFSVINKAPKVVINRTKTVFSEIVPTNAASPLVFTDKTRGELIEGSDITFHGEEFVSLDENLSMKPILTEGKFAGKKKSAKLTFLIQRTNWSQAVKVSHSLQVEGVPAIKLAKKSVLLNGVYKTSEEVSFSLTSQSVFEGCDIDWKVTPVGDSIESAILKAEITEEEKVRIRFTTSADSTVKAGTHKFQLSAVITNGQDTYEMKPVTISVKVNTNAQLTAKVSAKGKIDTLQRENGVIYTVKNITNVGYDTEKIRSVLQGVELVDIEGMESVTDKFISRLYVNEQTGKVEVAVTAKDEALLSTKTSYYFQLRFDMEELGAVFSPQLKIRPGQSAVKANVSGETALYSNYLNGTGNVQIKLVKPEGVEAELVEIQEATIPEGIFIDASKIHIDRNTITIPYQLTESAPNTLKAGKSYTIKCLITPKGMATNKKPQAVSVKFVVKK